MTTRAVAALAGLALAGAVLAPAVAHADATVSEVFQAKYSSVHSTYLATVDQGTTYMQIVFDHAPIEASVLPFMRADLA